MCRYYFSILPNILIIAIVLVCRCGENAAHLDYAVPTDGRTKFDTGSDEYVEVARTRSKDVTFLSR
jgi:hypothetical protein